MGRIGTTVGVVAAGLLCAAAAGMDLAPATERPEPAKPLIQVAVLLDTSGSMDGLIEQAKTQLWRIVNEFATARRDGQLPELQVALYEYGKSSIPAEQGYLRTICPLTTDLDAISEELFALKTNGGDEYCGRVIQSAVTELAWSKDVRDLKLIFIAGNEPFTQGEVDYRKACKAAIEKGIVVNTIFCGPHQQGIDTNWKDGADLADGSYMNIDQNQAVVHIDAPQDAEIARLGQQLNTTYLAFGVAGRRKAARQEALDVAALAIAAPVAAERQLAKASSLYEAGDWDLVDALEKDEEALAKMKDEDLPDEMRDMTPAERKAYVEAKAKEREEIQEKVRKLAAEREKFIVAKRAELAERGEDTLDAVIIKAVRTQAKAKGFAFEEPKAE